MHIAKLKISGVRGFHGMRAVDLDLTRPDGSLAGWTVVAGRNGSGKSTLLQAVALVFAGPRAVGLIPNLGDWVTDGSESSKVDIIIQPSPKDSYQQSLFEDVDAAPRAWISLEKSADSQNDPEVSKLRIGGIGIDSIAQENNISMSHSRGWFYAGYGPFRHMGNAANWRPRKNRSSIVPRAVYSLFGEEASLADAVDWLIEQHLYQLEKRAGATDLMKIVLSLLGDGLLPDEFRICRVDSDGLWVSNAGSEYPLREMSDGYRAVTALVVDIIHQMHVSYRSLKLQRRGGIPVLAYPGVVLIDEIDAHLHISWQQTIGAWLKDHFPEIQFIVTTHSPYICQSADPNGLIVLPGPRESRQPHMASQELQERVLYGSGDDAVLTELFGISTPYSNEAVKLRRRLGDLEFKVLEGSASEAEQDEFRFSYHSGLRSQPSRSGQGTS